MSRTGNSWRALAFLGLVLSGCVEGRGALLETAAQPAQELVTVYPREIDDVLYNPGMGVADFISDSAIHRRWRSTREPPWPISAGPGRNWNRRRANTTLRWSTA